MLVVYSSVHFIVVRFCFVCNYFNNNAAYSELCGISVSCSNYYNSFITSVFVIETNSLIGTSRERVVPLVLFANFGR